MLNELTQDELEELKEEKQLAQFKERIKKIDISQARIALWVLANGSTFAEALDIAETY